MLNAERGDTINFEFQDFPVQNNADKPAPLPMEAKLMMGIVMITALFLMCYIVLKMKQLKISQDAVKAQLETAKATAAAGSSSGSSVPESSPEAIAPLAGTSGSEDTGGYFSFVGAHNAKQFVDVLKNNELPVDQLAIVLSYLNAGHAKMVMDTLDESKQLEIIAALTQEQIADKATLDGLQDTLKSQLECAVGGAAKLSALIAPFNDASKKTFLSSIQSNADDYNKVRPDIFLFEDIEKLEDGEVKKLVGVLNIEVLAASIAKDDGASAKLNPT